jgi:hypothetical protein
MDFSLGRYEGLVELSVTVMKCFPLLKALSIDEIWPASDSKWSYLDLNRILGCHSSSLRVISLPNNVRECIIPSIEKRGNLNFSPFIALESLDIDLEALIDTKLSSFNALIPKTLHKLKLNFRSRLRPISSQQQLETWLSQFLTYCIQERPNLVLIMVHCWSNTSDEGPGYSNLKGLMKSTVANVSIHRQVWSPWLSRQQAETFVQNDPWVALNNVIQKHQNCGIEIRSTIDEEQKT